MGYNKGVITAPPSLCGKEATTQATHRGRANCFKGAVKSNNQTTVAYIINPREIKKRRKEKKKLRFRW